MDAASEFSLAPAFQAAIARPTRPTQPSTPFTMLHQPLRSLIGDDRHWAALDLEVLQSRFNVWLIASALI